MIKFININQSIPYIMFRDKYIEATNAEQENANAMAISSFNSLSKESNSRYVNLNIIEKDRFIFFTNYLSPKAKEFEMNNQVSALIFWPKINMQIRMKCHISQTSSEYNNTYFTRRSPKKNALAISSNQSKQIDSFDLVKKNYYEVLQNNDLKKCPKYWGGFALIPYEIEFWEGDKFRLNKRTLYKKNKNHWDHFILEP